nr:hypothetical protein [uncultured Actinoplanes sp.]
MWIWILVAVLAVIILAAVSGRVLGRLRELQRAGARLRHREAEARKLQHAAENLRERLEALERRAETTQERLAGITGNRK